MMTPTSCQSLPAKVAQSGLNMCVMQLLKWYADMQWACTVLSKQDMKFIDQIRQAGDGPDRR